MQWPAIMLHIILGVVFLASAMSKLTMNVDDMQASLLIPPWMWTLTGVVELVGAAGLLAGLRHPRLATVAGLGLAATMAGAIVAHVRVADPLIEAMPAVIFLVLTLIVAARGTAWVTGRPSAMERGRARSSD
jgi:uncharacterized membrane protein YphA (DoxX/SURF4 family)